ncbi:MAG: ABC transporter permease [Clostridia bacterium]|nr:ABC transporter permease [Clostridia bacterium]
MGILNWVMSLPGAVCQGLIWGIMAIGVYITFRILDVADLSVDGSFATGAVVCAILVINGVPVYIGMIAGTVAGMLAGLLTGLLHTFMGIPAILAGILTQLMLYSINLKILGQANRGLSGRTYDLIVSGLQEKWKAILILVGFTLVIIGVLYWFFGTELGISLRSTGNNIRMSRAQGINTSVTTVIGLVLSNGIVALSGALLAQYQGFADISMGRGAIVIGLAAVVVGEAVSSKIGSNFIIRLSGVMVGAIIYFIVYQTVIFLGLDSDLLKMLSAVVVAVFLGIPYIKKTYFSKKIKKSGGKK